MKTNTKTVIVTEAILLGILAATIIFLVVSYETPEEKAEIKGLEGEIEVLETELAQKNLEYNWLSEITGSLLKEEITEIPTPIVSPKIEVTDPSLVQKDHSVEDSLTYNLLSTVSYPIVASFVYYKLGEFCS